MKHFTHFTYKNNILHCENVALNELAQQYGTPLYVYSYQHIIDQYHKWSNAFKNVNLLTCYAVKANTSKSIMASLFQQGCGADIVSGGELLRALAAGCSSQKIVYSGVGKTKTEIELALDNNILMINVESEQELLTINDVAKSKNKTAPISIRVNPDVDAQTHAYISTGMKKNKFGVSHKRAFKLYKEAKELTHIAIKGISSHIGSQITNSSPFKDAARKIRNIVLSLKDIGITLEYIDVGGGLGITYKDETVTPLEEYATAITETLQDLGCQIITEPGRFMVGNSAVMITQVLYKKTGEGGTNFIIVDSGFNDLMRPMLYDAYHHIVPIQENENCQIITANIEGPICESTDRLAKDRQIKDVKQGEFLAIMSAGAYCMSMANNYNSRCRPAEILVKGDEHFVIKKRDGLDDITKNEQMPVFLDCK